MRLTDGDLSLLLLFVRPARMELETSLKDARLKLTLGRQPTPEEAGFPTLPPRPDEGGHWSPAPKPRPLDTWERERLAAGIQAMESELRGLRRLERKFKRTMKADPYKALTQRTGFS